MNNLVIIHIGKCGGTSVINELKNNNINYKDIHVREVNYNVNKKYVIVIRNPIQRFISAFNWRYYLVCDSKIQKNRFVNEKNILNKYKNIDNLCKDLQYNKNIFNGNVNSGKYIHHLKEDIFFYLKNFIDVCPKNQILGVICTETIKNDMKEIFNIDIIKHNKNNYTYDKKISNYSYKILKEYLKKDYDIIERMYKYCWITEEQYLILNI